MKERTERLKSNVKVTTAPVEDKDMFAQMKKLLSKNSSHDTSNLSNKDHKIEPRTVRLPDIQLTPNILSLIEYLLNLRSTKSKLSGEHRIQTMFVDAVSGAFDIIENACRTASDTPIQQKMMLQHTEELFLELIFDGMHTNLPPPQVYI